MPDLSLPHTATVTTPTYIALNRSEHGALAFEGYTGPINQPHLLSFEGEITPEAMREALWQATLSWPRMRSVLVPSWLSWRLEVLPEGPDLHVLVDHAFRVSPSTEAPSAEMLESMHRDELNTPLCLERGLPWRAWFIAHPTHPVLLLNIHHIVGDGHSMFRIHRSILQRINGQPIERNPVESGNQSPALMPRHWWQWPGSVAAWWRNERHDARLHKGRKLITLASRASRRYTVSSLRHVTLPISLAEAKDVAHHHGTTINVLIASLLAEALLSRESVRSPQDPEPVVKLRVAVDLRRHFPEGTAPRMGNLVGNVMLYAAPRRDIASQMNDLKRQSQDQLGRLERRELALPYRVQDGFAMIGRRLLTKLVLDLKARGGPSVPSVFISNLGSADSVTPDNARVRLKSLWTTSMGVSLFVSIASLDNRLQLVFTWQCDQTEAADVDALIRQVKAQCEDLLALQAPDAPDARHIA